MAVIAHERDMNYVLLSGFMAVKNRKKVQIHMNLVTILSIINSINPNEMDKWVIKIKHE